MIDRQEVCRNQKCERIFAAGGRFLSPNLTPIPILIFFDWIRLRLRLGVGVGGLLPEVVVANDAGHCFTYPANSAFPARFAASASKVRVAGEASNFRICRARSLPS